MSSDPKHTTITVYDDKEDGSIEAVTETYFENLSSRKKEVIKKIRTSHKEFLSDIVGCLDVINQKQTKDLTLRITVDEYYNPQTIVKQWTVVKENFNKRR